MYPGGYFAAPPNPAYLPPAHYYAYPVPAAAPTPPEPMDNYSPPLVPHQQKELNMASSILRNLNPAGGLFDQPAAHTLALSACPRANSVPSAFQTWDQPTVSKPRPQWPPPRINDNNWTLSYIDKPGNPADEHASCNGPPRD
ncbi:hypothetical protein J132_07697 [Termitomyces sp. J132]|nr:hypothetical protein J132_07697 [Termitomyces sp. J132]